MRAQPDTPDLLTGFAGRLIVSCQAGPNDPLAHPDVMARFAQAAVQGGAAAIRANGVDDIRAIRRAVSVPIIGIDKTVYEDGGTLITPSFESAECLVKAGADLVALDCTRRGQRSGAHLRLQRIRSELNVPVLADIATLEEAVAAEDAGAHAVLSTMHGYTVETSDTREFDPAFVRQLVAHLNIPVIAEGRIVSSDQARAAIRAGALAVVVGTAITRPAVIARTFAVALESERRFGVEDAYIVGVDLGGTNTKAGIVSSTGRLVTSEVFRTPAHAGRAELMHHLRSTTRRILDCAGSLGISPTGIGIATAGWVNPESGQVVYATGNLPGWTGARIADALDQESNLPVSVVNDANAAALAERTFGLARDVDNFVCLTLGTGIGCGCFLSGALHKGARFMANAVGHIQIEENGRSCTCGLRGCLEAYAGAAALLRYAGNAFASPEELIAAATAGDAKAVGAVRTYARYVAMGCAMLVQLLDPEMLILSGGLVEGNNLIVDEVHAELTKRVAGGGPPSGVRRSTFGNTAGVIGAAAAAWTRL